MEYELLDTGVFDADRYFDVEIEYAKAAPDDLLCRVTVHNRGPERRPSMCCPRCRSGTRGVGRRRALAPACSGKRRYRNCVGGPP